MDDLEFDWVCGLFGSEIFLLFGLEGFFLISFWKEVEEGMLCF